MGFNVAGQGVKATALPEEPHFFPKKTVARTVQGSLVIDKAAIAARVKAASVASSDEASFIARLIEAIRRFLARICNSFRPGRSGPLGNSDNSLNTPANHQSDSPLLTETENELRVDGLPEPSLDRVRQTVNDLVDSADGMALPNSLRSALAMPEIGRRQAFRVLLQQNISDTVQMREVSKAIQHDVQRMIEPFAQQHGIEPAAAVAIFRADLDSGGGVLANRIDPNSELRGHVAEWKKLDSALAGLAQCRGVICTHAIEGGGYTREEIAALVAQQGFDTEFLFKAEADAARPVIEPVIAEGGSRVGNVVSLASYRGHEPVMPPDYSPSKQLEDVSKAIKHLVEEGAIDQESANTVVEAAVVDAALSDESEFETEIQGDDLGDFVKKRHTSAPSMKP